MNEASKATKKKIYILLFNIIEASVAALQHRTSALRHTGVRSYAPTQLVHTASSHQSARTSIPQICLFDTRQ